MFNFWSYIAQPPRDTTQCKVMSTLLVLGHAGRISRPTRGQVLRHELFQALTSARRPRSHGDDRQRTRLGAVGVCQAALIESSELPPPQQCAVEKLFRKQGATANDSLAVIPRGILLCRKGSGSCAAGRDAEIGDVGAWCSYGTPGGLLLACTRLYRCPTTMLFMGRL